MRRVKFGELVACFERCSLRSSCQVHQRKKISLCPNDPPVACCYIEMFLNLAQWDYPRPVCALSDISMTSDAITSTLGVGGWSPKRTSCLRSAGPSNADWLSPELRIGLTTEYPVLRIFIGLLRNRGKLPATLLAWRLDFRVPDIACVIIYWQTRHMCQYCFWCRHHLRPGQHGIF